MSYEVPPAFPSYLRNPDDEDGLWIDGARLAILRRQGKEPTFGVKDLAMTFFAKSGSWLRMRSQPPRDPEPGTQAARHPAGWFTVWGDLYTPLKINRVKGRDDTYEFRRFTLQDAELMLWSFYEHETLDAANYFTNIAQTGKRGEHRMTRYQQMAADAEHHLHVGIEVVKWIGRLHGVTPMPPYASGPVPIPAEEYAAFLRRQLEDLQSASPAVFEADEEFYVTEDSGAEETPGN